MTQFNCFIQNFMHSLTYLKQTVSIERKKDFVSRLLMNVANSVNSILAGNMCNDKS